MTNTATRFDGDSWDLATSVGVTATAVAASRAIASQGPDALLDDRFAEPLVRAVGIQHFVDLIEGTIAIDDDPVLSRRAMSEQMTVRTRFFDDFFTAATESGIRQAVILAVGLDTRAYRLSWPAGTTVFELDQPEVIAFKSTTLAELGAEPSAQRRTVGVDRRGAADLPAARGTGQAARRPDNAVRAGQPDRHRADGRVERSRRIGSSINLADLFYGGERNTAADYLGAKGWRTELLTTDDAFAVRGFEQPDDEMRAFEGSNSGYLTATLDA